MIRELAGHGIGRAIREPPIVPNFDDPSAHSRLSEGLVITVEPIISTGSGRVQLDADGWTIRATDRALAAHYQHTVMIAKGSVILLTAA